MITKYNKLTDSQKVVMVYYYFETLRMFFTPDKLNADNFSRDEFEQFAERELERYGYELVSMYASKYLVEGRDIQVAKDMYGEWYGNEA